MRRRKGKGEGLQAGSQADEEEDQQDSRQQLRPGMPGADQFDAAKRGEIKVHVHSLARSGRLVPGPSGPFNSSLWPRIR